MLVFQSSESKACLSWYLPTLLKGFEIQQCIPRFIISPVFFYLTSTSNEWSDLDFLKDIIFRNTHMLTATYYDYIKTYSTHYNWIEDNSEFIFAARSRSLHKLGKKEFTRGGKHPFLSEI